MSQDHSLWADSVTIAEITQLRKDLAEKEAECLKLRGVLKTVRDNAPEPYCAITRAVDTQVREALSTPPSSIYLEQWEKERYQSVCEVGTDVFADIYMTLPVGTKLYARKD
jgi:hypothetical protein